MSGLRALFPLALGIVVVAACGSDDSASPPPHDAGTDGPRDATAADVHEASTACNATCPAIGTGGGQFNQDMCGACDTCMAAMCCTELTTCLAPAADGGEGDCKVLIECLQAARTDANAIAACQGAHQASMATYQLLNDCLVHKCPQVADAGGACQ